MHTNVTKLFCIYSSLALIFISSLKWNTGTDWPAYLEVYNNVENINIFNEHFEPIYIALLKLLRLISDSFTFYQICFSILVIGIKFYAASLLKYPLLAVVLIGITFQFDIYFVRYDLALSIIFLMLTIGNREKITTILWYFVSFGVHKVGIVAVIISLLFAKLQSKSERKKLMFIYILLCISVIWMISQPSFIFKLATGVYNFELKTSIDIKFLHRVWYFILILVLYKISKPDEKDAKLLHVLLIGAIFYITIALVDIGSLERIFGIFLVYEIYYLSNVKITNRQAYVAVFLATIGVVRIYQFFASDYIDLYLPYETILETKFKNVY